MIQRSSKKTTVQATKPPEPPAGFAGAVGDLKYSVAVDPTRLRIGESATVEITVSGHGNLPLIQAPQQWPECPGCKLYPPEEESKITVDTTGIHGRKTWKATLLVRDAGHLALSPVSLAVFDPKKSGYRVQEFDSLYLDVEESRPTPTPTPVTVGTNVSPSVGGDRGKPGPMQKLPTWLLLVGTLLLGGSVGGGVAWWMTRNSSGKLPPRHRGQSPAERARQLQSAVERWWLDLPEAQQDSDREAEMKAIRKELEAIRFAPGRADHRETIAEIEKKLKRLMR